VFDSLGLQAKLALEALEVPVGVSNFLLFFIPVALSRYYYQLNYYLSVCLDQMCHS